MCCKGNANLVGKYFEPLFSTLSPSTSLQPWTQHVLELLNHGRGGNQPKNCCVTGWAYTMPMQKVWQKSTFQEVLSTKYFFRLEYKLFLHLEL